MRTLILMRHAKAMRAHEALDDRARGLTGRGRRDAGEAGAALATGGFAPELALISPALRTRETAECALGSFTLKSEFVEDLYNASPQTIWDAFAETKAESVIVIGHNPGLAELITHLIEEARDRSALARSFSGHLPTAAWAAFAIGGSLVEAPGAQLLAGWAPPRGDD